MTTQESSRIAKIKDLRRCLRREVYINGKVGILIKTGKGYGIFCIPSAGLIMQARVNEYDLWVLWGYAMGRLRGEYLSLDVPGIGAMYNHIVIAVALGLYDNDKNLMLKINHKNYIKTDCRSCNLELCNDKENSKHREFRQVIINIGISLGKTIWIEGMAIEAKHAAFIMDTSKNYIHKLLEGFNKYVYMSC